METVGDRLRAARKQLGLSGKAFGAPLGVTHSTVSYWEVGRTPIPMASLSAIATAHSISEEWLLTGKGQMRLERDPRTIVQVPVLQGLPTCGPGGEIQDPGPVADYHPFSLSFIEEVIRQCGGGQPANLFLTTVSGDSMKPLLENGDRVLVNNAMALRTAPQKGKMFLVRSDRNTSEAKVKRVFYTPGAATMAFYSENTAYHPELVTIDSIPLQDLILGRVCWYERLL